MCLSPQSFHLGDQKDGENICCYNAKITEKNFIAQAALLLDSRGPLHLFLSLQRTENWRFLVIPAILSLVLTFLSKALSTWEALLWYLNENFPALCNFHHLLQMQAELKKTFDYLLMGLGAAEHFIFYWCSLCGHRKWIFCCGLLLRLPSPPFFPCVVLGSLSVWPSWLGSYRSSANFGGKVVCKSKEAWVTL